MSCTLVIPDDGPKPSDRQTRVLRRGKNFAVIATVGLTLYRITN